jgi:hypothetical protein
LGVEKKIASLYLSLFPFSLSDVGENGGAAFIRRGIGNRKHASYVDSINSSIKNHSLVSAAPKNPDIHV